MKAIKNWMLFTIFIYTPFSAQDSLTVAQTNQYYKSFFMTDILAISDSGQNVILRDFNGYGKDVVKVYSNKTNKTFEIPNGGQYFFLDDQHILVGAAGKVSFVNLKDLSSIDVEGSYHIHIVKERGIVVLFDRSSKKLLLYGNKAKKIWEHENVEDFLIDPKGKFMVYYNRSEIFKTEFQGLDTVSAYISPDTLKIKISADFIEVVSVDALEVQLLRWNTELKNLSSYSIHIPEGYKLNAIGTEKIDIREGRYLLIPMTIKKVQKISRPSDAIITYTNEKFSAFLDAGFAGIYDLEEERWQWMPDKEMESPSQIFLNNKGDFLVADVGRDFVENVNNPLVDMVLMTDYGRAFYNLGKSHTSKVNYYFDDKSQTLLFFKDSKWWHFDLKQQKVIALMEDIKQEWHSLDHHGLNSTPVDAIMPTSERNKVIISGRFDLFLLDLRTCKAKRITHGEKENIVYSVYKKTNQDQDFTFRNALERPEMVILKLRNIRNYDSGYAVWDKKLKMLVFGKDNYIDLIITAEKMFAISQAYQQPVKITKLIEGDTQVVFDNTIYVTNQLKHLQMKLFNFTTPLGVANAALLYPINYDPSKSYPMIVNLYEQKSREVLYYSIPSLIADDGFNFLHYVYEGYFVLLPDMQYKAGNIPEGMIMSLNESVRTALGTANIDPQNLAVIGMSFGGFEAGLALSNTTLFRTGMVGSMFADLVSSALSTNTFLPQPNYIRIENEQVGINESVFDNWNKYIEQSPIFHAYKINNPILLWSGLKDYNIPPSQTREYFLALKRLSKKAVLLEYPLEDHTLTTFEAKQDLTVKAWQWMEFFLKENRSAVWIKPLLKEAPL